MTSDYTNYSELSGLYLEDSFVLEMSQTPGEVRFTLDAVLTRQHPAYRDALPGEQYCYARGHLIFAAVTEVHWCSRSGKWYTDAAGEVDLGNIDSFTNIGGEFALEGDWGEIRIRTDSDPRFAIL